MSASLFAPELPRVFALSSDFVVSDLAGNESDDEDVGDEALPDSVKQFVQWWYAQWKAQRTFELHAVYETHFDKITERFYKASAWPSGETIAPLVDNDVLFVQFYKTLYYKHLTATLPVTPEQRADAWSDLCALFEQLLAAESADAVACQVPLGWLWHCVDSLVALVVDGAALRAGMDCAGVPDDAFSADVALDTLRRLSAKADVAAVLGAPDAARSGFAAHPLYHALGYFAIVAQTRILCARGDYADAIAAAAPIDTAKEGLYGREPDCQTAFFHALAFALLMDGRHAACVRVASASLLYAQRTKQYAASKTSERLVALLAFASALFAAPLDEPLLASARDSFASAMVRVTRGDAAAFDELFVKSCPRLVDPAATPLAKRAAATGDAVRVVASGVRAAARAAARRQHALLERAQPQLRSVLAIYASIGIAQLAAVLGVDAAECRRQLDAYAASVDASCDVTFTIEAGDVLRVVAPPRARETPRDFFLHQIGQFSALNDVVAPAH
eukprot:TRINITY_DN213_c0_g1_i2.p1 TRINITY_DN213_c0_g1~~TRINITY_DN213_c0_g1_i2.p1  ORF type:complete len:505 (-),score=366.19 TRINITY_DN213_c0_g1_i2:96-1610(-)